MECSSRCCTNVVLAASKVAKGMFTAVCIVVFGFWFLVEHYSSLATMKEVASVQLEFICTL